MKRLVKRLFRRPVPAQSAGRQQGPEYYDGRFRDDPSWCGHYTTSMYYSIWTVIVDRVRRAGARAILEIGCGPGQLARALHDALIVERYCGFDFSSVGIAQARRAVPSYRFEVADALTTDLYDAVEYDLVISTEFLEHVEGDVVVLGRVRPNARVIATVPNFPYISHVRHFTDPAAVRGRYGRFFSRLTVDPIPLNEAGSVLFLLEGIRTQGA